MYLNISLNNNLPNYDNLIVKQSEINSQTISNLINTNFDYITSFETKHTISKNLCCNSYFSCEKITASDNLIIVDGKIVAAGAILPVSKNPNIPRHLGLRHRAAMGISEKSDALVIIVSEETGTISMAVDGAYRLNLTAEDLERNLTELLVTSV